MTSRSIAWLVAAAFLAALALACSGGTAQLRSEDVDTAAMPPDVLASYRVFVRRCSKCHALARVYDSGITDDDFWVRYVERMRRQPGSGITHGDESVILHYLYYYSALRRDAGSSRPQTVSLGSDNGKTNTSDVEVQGEPAKPNLPVTMPATATTAATATLIAAGHGMSTSTDAGGKP